ncbi:hypothetical protein ACFY9Q_33335 [Streptomyces sp. NPDC012389]|uniref:hypothetical protein n=1 Tax=Streptomyces sp. NPDC012389 TaxID=3364830 RepID=UPI0036E2C685
MSAGTPSAAAAVRSRAGRAGATAVGPGRQRPRTAGALVALTPARREALRAECARLEALDDAEFGVRLLAHTPTHETREEALLRHWAQTATEFGRELAVDATSPTAAASPRAELSPPAQHAPRPARVVETTGGLDRLLLARYTSRPEPTVELFTDTIALGEQLVDVLGWRDRYPAGSLRAAALAHEHAHCLLHRDARIRRALRDRLGHTALRLGRFRVPGHVAGADEVAAHAYAGAVCGLGRSPLLLTAALVSAVQALGED